MHISHQKPDWDFEGIVYVVERDGLYKIGKTFDLDQRLKALRKHKKTVTVIHVIETNKRESVEYALHRTFEHKRIKLGNGETGQTEWFMLTDQDIRDIKTIPSKYII